MSLASLAFLNPWILAALASLPLLYWLLRTVPPRPKQIAFPATRILVGLENKEKTPAKTPWWLLLIRLLAAALIIFALAKPILNPEKALTFKGDGPVVLVIDNGWSSAANWQKRTVLADRMIDSAQSEKRPLIIVPTAQAAKAESIKLESPADARATINSLTPQPFPPDRQAAIERVQKVLQDSESKNPTVVWMSDSIDHDGAGQAFIDEIAKVAASGDLAIATDGAGNEPLGLSATVSNEGALVAKVLRTDGPARVAQVLAISARGERLGSADVSLSAGATSGEAKFEMPLELRNQVTRLELGKGQSAGSVQLLDGRSQWQRVGMLSGETQEQAQPLLAPLYYIDKAIRPFAEVIRPKDLNLLEGLDTILDQNASVLVLADIGRLTGEVRDNINDWVNRGGVLVRFAGPRLEGGGDDLLPVPLRSGGRTLGGALSWSTPQPLASFDGKSLFAGLKVPSEVTINRQVLADPAQIGPNVKVWARLTDGTPLVTATSRGAGEIVLFHVTANTDWSQLPISGLFVDMLRRITQLGQLAGGTGTNGETTGGNAATDAQADFLLPVQTLDGLGILREPPPTAESLKAADFQSATVNAEHPPGYYGPAGAPRALNVLSPTSDLKPLPSAPASAVTLAYDAQSSTPLSHWLFTAALALVFADILAVLILGGLLTRVLRPQTVSAMLVAGLTAAIAATAIAPLDPAHAQGFWRKPEEAGPKLTGPDAIVQKATANVTLAYVKTGDQEVDDTSRQGLSGLSRVLAARTAIEPAEPIGIDVINDDISFLPVLYWPVIATTETLPEKTLAKIDAFMKQGGLIIFDTRDFGTGLSGTQLSGQNGRALKRLLGSLDIPKLSVVPDGHVLTRSFYLLDSFPGRWDGGELWVDANTATTSDVRQARQADGVTSIMITSNDLAGAWALDKTGRPLYPTVPGGEPQREMSLRSGINIVMHALTGNYKADQVHVPALLQRLGQ